MASRYGGKIERDGEIYPPLVCAHIYIYKVRRDVISEDFVSWIVNKGVHSGKEGRHGHRHSARGFKMAPDSMETHLYNNMYHDVL